MGKFASGKYAYGISDRSGMRYKLRDMKIEWNGSLVGPDEFEPKHPQLGPFRVPIDGQALKNARTDRNEPAVAVLLGLNPFVHAGSGLVTVTEKNHGRSTGDTVRFRTATGIGTQITKPLIESASGYSITVTTTDQYTFTIPNIGGVSPTINHPYHGQGSSNKYAINGSTASSNVILTLIEGRTYRFDQADSSNAGHPIRIYEDANKSTQYNTGVTVNGTPGQAGAYTEITVPHGAPTLFYQCSNHALMGAQLNTTTASSTTYTVTVQGDGYGNNLYYIDGSQQATLSFTRGNTYIFDWSAATGHPVRLSTTSNGTHGGGSEYTTGVTKDDSAYKTTITVASNAPSTLYYYCQYHSGMGGTINVSGTAPGTTTYTVTVVDGSAGSADPSLLNIPFGGDIATVGPVTLEK